MTPEGLEIWRCLDRRDRVVKRGFGGDLLGSEGLIFPIFLANIKKNVFYFQFSF